jgi:serine protease Do
VKLKVWRDKSQREVEVKLGSADSQLALNDDGSEGAQGGQLGLALRPLTRNERQQVQGDAGMVVENVSGAAAKAGVQAGDLLLAINGQPVKSIEQLRDVMKSKPKNVALLVQREGETIFVPLKLG